MATILLLVFVAIGFLSRCGDDLADPELDPHLYCTSGADSCRNQAPGFGGGRLLGRVPELPPWRSTGGIWHIGVGTTAMLHDLAMAAAAAQDELPGELVRDDPPELAIHFLMRLDSGDFQSKDLGNVCALALWPVPLYWRNALAWTSKPDGSGKLTFAKVPDIPWLLDYSVRVLLSQWYEAPQKNETMLETFLTTADFTYSFLRIHPFFDGNGRCSRFMAGWMMFRELGFKLQLPEANATTRYSMGEMTTSRYLMLYTLNHHDASLFAAYLIDCAWDQLIQAARS